jgi:Arc/MetJ family transcription regulator
MTWTDRALLAALTAPAAAPAPAPAEPTNIHVPDAFTASTVRALTTTRPVDEHRSRNTSTAAVRRSTLNRTGRRSVLLATCRAQVRAGRRSPT